MSFIAWRIRRGVLELDHVFHGFYAIHDEKMSDLQKQQFVKLLEVSDPELLQWVIYRQPCPAEFIEVIALIHQYMDSSGITQR
jgi:succinate dehydrogenase flavin-adding protein (antitoxin of CptAB toxin-antitoxin module)